MRTSSLGWAGEHRRRFWQAKHCNQELFAERVWKPNQRSPNRSCCEAFENVCIAQQLVLPGAIDFSRRQGVQKGKFSVDVVHRYGRDPVKSS